MHISSCEPCMDPLESGMCVPAKSPEMMRSTCMHGGMCDELINCIAGEQLGWARLDVGGPEGRLILGRVIFLIYSRFLR